MNSFTDKQKEHAKVMGMDWENIQTAFKEADSYRQWLQDNNRLTIKAPPELCAAVALSTIQLQVEGANLLYAKIKEVASHLSAFIAEGETILSDRIKESCTKGA